MPFRSKRLKLRKTGVRRKYTKRAPKLTRKAVKKIVNYSMKRQIEPKIVDQNWILDPGTGTWANFTTPSTHSFAIPIDPIFGSDTSGGATKWWRQTNNNLQSIAWLSTDPGNANYADPTINEPIQIVSGHKIKRTGFYVKIVAVMNTFSGSSWPFTKIPNMISFTNSNTHFQTQPTVTSQLQYRIRIIRAKKSVSDLDMLKTIAANANAVSSFRPPNTYVSLYDKTFPFNHGIRNHSLKFAGKRGAQSFNFPFPPDSTFGSDATDNNLFLLVTFTTGQQSGANLVAVINQIPTFTIRVRNYYIDL